MKHIESHEFIENLKNNLLQINYFLNQRHKNYFDLTKSYLYNQTWCLVIGLEKSGKTSLFQNSDLNLLQCQAENNTPCNTWFNPNAAFFEIPESLDNSDVCNQVLQTIKRFGRKRPIDSILLTINIYDFLAFSPQELNEHAQQFTTFVTQMLHPALTHEIDIYLTFTHFDRIAGFTAFFSELGTKDRQQPLGYQFDHYATINNMLEQHHDKYNTLLSNMYDQLIGRLHKSRNSSNSYLIREFPLQIESLQQSIKTLLTKIAEIEPSLLKIKGVFFTSTRQSGTCHDRITASISKSYELVVNSDLPQASRDQAFFIDGMLKVIIKNSKHHYQLPSWIKPASVAASIATFCFIAGIISHYIQSSESLNKVSFELEQFEQLQQNISRTDNPTLDSLIPSLKYLSRASDDLNEASTWIFPFNDLNFIKQEINTAYRDTLTQDFLPLLTHEMEQQLLTQKNPAQNYEALKAYLMLGEPQQLNIDYLKHWLQQHWQNRASHDNFAASIKLLESSVREPYQGIRLKPNVIKQARDYLNNLPLNYLAYTLVKNNALKEGLSINHTTVPYMYLRNGFYEYVAHVIPKSMMQFQHEHWVLKNLEMNDFDNEQLISQVTKLYISDYNNFWQLFTLHIQPPTFDTIAAAQKYFSHILKESSPISELILVLQNNTRAFENPDKIQSVFNQQVALNFTNINLIASNTINYFSPAFTDLNKFFNTILASKNPDETCFNFAKSRFLNPYQSDPINQLITLSQKTAEPINNWLKSIASNSWILILQHSQNYINQQWNGQVFKEYQANIAGRFPIIPNSTEDIALDNFNHFFAMNGSLSLFFENYLKPFLDTKQAQWLPKQVNGISLPFARDNIMELERANVIRQMFYANNSEAAEVNFSLRPLSYETSINSALININGQIFKSDRGNSKSSNFVWPNKFQLYPTSVTLQIISGKQYQISEAGPWGLFKLLTRSDVTLTAADTQHFQIVFDLNGLSAKYLLTANNPINPFIPDIIQQLVLPEKIV